MHLGLPCQALFYLVGSVSPRKWEECSFSCLLGSYLSGYCGLSVHTAGMGSCRCSLQWCWFLAMLHLQASFNSHEYNQTNGPVTATAACRVPATQHGAKAASQLHCLCSGKYVHPSYFILAVCTAVEPRDIFLCVVLHVHLGTSLVCKEMTTALLSFCFSQI